jgi:hypothetical protein
MRRALVGGRLSRTPRLAPLLVGALLSLTGLAMAHRAGAAEPSDPALQLAQRHRPIVMVRAQPTACGEGEPYRPTDVGSVLGRDDVVLRSGDGTVVATAPTASLLYAQPEDTYLDVPGNPLKPECGYEERWDAMAAEHPPTLYARVATDPERPGRLVVQYWFWWVYNDWNDRHEGDWEMVQVVFDATSPEQALGQQPTTVVVAQHEGGQYADWGGSGMSHDGDRPIVFPAAGSHADYLSADRWFGKSGATGFGCDDTRNPHDRLEPDIVLLPSQVSDLTGPDDPFAWLAYQGRWGQKEWGFNAGPQGPATKLSWTNPIVWVEEEGRASAVALPPLGTASTDFFCSAAERGSLLFIHFLDQPLLVAGVVLLVILLLVVLVRRTRWRPSEPEPVGLPRRAGQVLLAAARLQRRHARPYLGLAAVVLAGGVVSVVVSQVVLAATGLGEAADLAGHHNAYAVPLALLAGALVTVPVVALVLASAAVVVDRLAEGASLRTGDILRQAVRSGGALRASLVQVVLLQAAAVLVLPALAGLFLLPRWAPSTPVAVRDEVGALAAFRRSSALTKGRRWRSFAVGATTIVAMLTLGPLAGTVLLLLTGMPFALVNLVAAVVSMAVVPWAGTALALLREDLNTRVPDVGETTGDD